MKDNLRRLCSVARVQIVYDEAGTPAPCSPEVPCILMENAELRQLLRTGSDSQSVPYLHRDSFGVFFAAVRLENAYLYLGPMSMEKFSGARLRQFYRSYGVECDDLPKLRTFTIREMTDIILLTAALAELPRFTSDELLYLNRILVRDDEGVRKDQVQFLIREEEENEEVVYRHSYHEEQLLMQAVRQGDTAAALRLAGEMDADVGRLSSDEIRHWRYLAIVGITLCARAAIDSGLSPETAYRLSGFYIQKCDEAKDALTILHYRTRALEEYTTRIHDRLHNPRSSNYVARCQDYISKHYREKIYLEDVAAALGISETYLSRIFRKETSICFQDYVAKIRVDRAADLLIYTEMSLPAVAEYVGFPNQSYMGKMFRKFRDMTPGDFRSQLRSVEAPRASTSKHSSVES